jgi:nicotinamidase/pyrazinamidase
MINKTALMIVDVQNDFCLGGTLAVPLSETVIEPLNRAIERFLAARLPILASRDWHPETTGHFQSYGGLWPAHCVQGTTGAAFHPRLRLPESAIIISKGMDESSDGYSAFDGIDASRTQLADLLNTLQVTRLCVGGLATDYCVKATVIEALQQGFEVVVLRDAVAAVNLNPGDGDNALGEMKNQGAKILPVTDLHL